jgi:predicted MPP superfamily phosphohydrolase
MARFLWILLAFTALSQVVPTLAAAHLAARAHFAHPAFWGALACVYGVGLFVGRARGRMTDTPRPWWLLHLVDEPYFAHWCASLLGTVLAVVVLIAAPLVDLARGAPIAFPSDGVTAAYLAALAICAYGVFYRRRSFRLRRVEVRVEGLPDAFDGYRIAHLSDMHVGALTPKRLAMRWARAANRLESDLAVVTGDMVTSGTAFHADIAAVVGSLRAPDGVVVSMGNHDYFGGDGEPLLSLLRAAGVRVLRNEGEVLRRGDGNVYLAAIDDTWTRRSDLDAALSARPADAPTILLAHDPDEFRAAARRGVDLVLSGHTHGGQVAVPFFERALNLSKLSHHHHLGLYRRGKSTLYVHPGLGTTGPPIRIGVAPAVVEITLRRA